MYYAEIQLYEGRSKRNLQALLFEVLDLMKFYMVLTGMALSVYGHVSWGTCTEEAQLCHFNMVTHLENGLTGKVEEWYSFCNTLRDSVILLHDVWLHTAQQTM